MKIKDIPGKTAFLNGQSGLHELDRELYDLMLSEGKEVRIFDNLFDSVSELKDLVFDNYQNLVVITTGVHREELEIIYELFIAFRKAGYTPKRVISLTEQTTMALLGAFKEFKEYGVKFYDWFDDEIEEIQYV